MTGNIVVAEGVTVVDLDIDDGKIRGPGWEGDLGGNCPVQGAGFVNGLPWYFRSRGSRWTIDVAGRPDGDPVDEGDAFQASGAWGFDFEAGWMEREWAIEIIASALATFRVARRHAPQMTYEASGEVVQEEKLLDKG